MRTNQFAATCVGCSGWVHAREGRYEGKKADGSGSLVYHRDCSSLPAHNVGYSPTRTYPTLSVTKAALPVARFDVYGRTWSGGYERQNADGLLYDSARRRALSVSSYGTYERVVFVREGTNPRHSQPIFSTR